MTPLRPIHHLLRHLKFLWAVMTSPPLSASVIVRLGSRTEFNLSRTLSSARDISSSRIMCPSRIARMRGPSYLEGCRLEFGFRCLGFMGSTLHEGLDV